MIMLLCAGFIALKTTLLTENRELRKETALHMKLEKMTMPGENIFALFS